jgi:predicted alpha/beta-hydrolase family hydrolase
MLLVADGDHSLVPRKSSGRTRERNWEESAAAIAAFIAERASAG